MGVGFDYRTINYTNQAEFDYFFATAFDRYDRNRDGVIDYREFQPLINDMCQMITQRYGYGPTVDKIRAAWSSLDFNGSGYITRNEFSTRARYELERILTQPDYIPLGYNPGMYGTGFGAPAYPPSYPPPACPPVVIPPPGGYGGAPACPPVVIPPPGGAPACPPVVIPPPGGYGGYPPY